MVLLRVRTNKVWIFQVWHGESGELSYTDSVDAEGDGQVLAVIYNLIPETPYYYDLYAVTKLSPEVMAGNEISFTTLAHTNGNTDSNAGTPIVPHGHTGDASHLTIPVTF